MLQCGGPSGEGGFKNPDFGAPSYSSGSWGWSPTVCIELVGAMFLPQLKRMEKMRAGGVQG